MTLIADTITSRASFGSLDLLPAHLDGMLEILERSSIHEEWEALLSSDAFAYHKTIEDQPYDTDFSDLRRQGINIVKNHVQDLKGLVAGKSPFYVLNFFLDKNVSAIDVFVLSGVNTLEQQPDRYRWLREQMGPRPLVAFRLAGTLFWRPGRPDAPWQAAPWTSHSAEMLSLPYSRKYDRERHGRIDAHLRWAWEALEVAHDLLSVFAERLDETLPQEEDGLLKFVWPGAEDIHKELHCFGLDFVLDDLSSFAGIATIDLVTVRNKSLGDGGAIKDELEIDKTVASGSYRGVLGGYHRRRTGVLRPSLSPSSLKWMFMSALKALIREIEDCTCLALRSDYTTF